MKFICQSDDSMMEWVETITSESGGSLAVKFQCPTCGRGVAMVTNPGETQVVRSLGVTIGHDSLVAPAPEPMALVRGALAGQTSRAEPDTPEPVWTDSALKRLAAAPSFVQGMIRRIYTDYGRQKGYSEITPAVMTEARDALGMTGL